MTGFAGQEYSVAGKLLELLKQIAPRLSRVAVIRTTNQGGIGQYGAIQLAAPALGVEITPVNATDTGDIERSLAGFVRGTNDGLIVTGSAFATLYRELIIALAAKHKLPAVYPARSFVTRGALISYGYNPLDALRGAAGYIDRILKGEKAADLPVQAPTKYEMVINLKTAKALGLDVPAQLLARADEVIE
jgi:putative ABC transport system substrate-binding protein